MALLEQLIAQDDKGQIQDGYAHDSIDRVMSSAEKQLQLDSLIQELDNVGIGQGVMPEERKGEVSPWFPQGQFLGYDVPQGSDELLDIITSTLLLGGGGRAAIKATKAGKSSVGKSINYLRNIFGKSNIQKKDIENINKAIARMNTRGKTGKFAVDESLSYRPPMALSREGVRALNRVKGQSTDDILNKINQRNLETKNRLDIEELANIIRKYGGKVSPNARTLDDSSLIEALIKLSSIN